jgi:hypothetical protein
MSRTPAPWLSLLAPLPADVVPHRAPVAAPGTPQAAPDSPIAGWQSLIVDRSDLPFGGRVVHVTLDAAGVPISASDHVYLRDVDATSQAPADPVQMRQLSVGGRIEADGTFRGTHWTTAGPEPADDEEPQWQMTPRPPTEREIAALMALVHEVMARAPAG